MYNETIQPPETNGTIFLLGAEFAGAEFVRAKFVRGRVCQGPRCPGIVHFGGQSFKTVFNRLPTTVNALVI